MPSYPTRLGHAHLKVRDLRRAVAFYTKFFDLKVVEQLGDAYAFLSGSSVHHDLALQSVGPGAPAPPARGVGLYHVAFEVPDARAFALAYQALTEAGIDVYPIDHLISWAMYFNDPDGNGLEIYWDTRGRADGANVWQGQNVALPAERILAALAPEEAAGRGH